MKSHEETIRTVFERIETNRKKLAKRRRILCTAVPLLCLGLLLLALQPPVVLREEPPVLSSASAETSSAAPGEEYSILVESVDDITTPEEDQIIVHAIDGVSDDRMNICLHMGDFVELNRDELTAYYGTTVFPTVPGDLAEWEDQQYGIFRRNGGTGEVYWDGNVLNYSNGDFSRSVSVEVKKGQVCPICYAFFDSVEEKSTINGVEIALGLSSNGYYYAEFMHNGVGFFVVAERLSQDEMVGVLVSLLQ